MSQSSINSTLLLLEPAETAWGPPEPDERMMLTLYAKPPDYPEQYVMRAWYVSPRPQRSAGASLVFQTIEDAERFVAWAFPELKLVGRAMDEDTPIVGCWL